MPRGEAQFEPSLSPYFSDLSRLKVPTRSEEEAVFRRIVSMESRLTAFLLVRKGAEEALRKTAKEEGEELPQCLLKGKETVEKALRFVRLNDAGRTWMQAQVASLRSDGRSSREALTLAAEVDDEKGKFAAANLRLVLSVAKRYAKFCHHLTVGDLIQEGNLGLIKAVDRFDPDRGFKFATYAMWWVRQNIKRSMSDKEGPVRIPVHVGDAAMKLNRIGAVHHAAFGHEMELEDAAALAGIPITKARTAMQSKVRGMVYLDAPTGEEGGVTYLDCMAGDPANSPVEALAASEMRESLLTLLSGLSPFESRIIRHRFGVDDAAVMTLQEIAEECDLSRERIRQIETKALQKLRRGLRGRNISEYFPEAG